MKARWPLRTTASIRRPGRCRSTARYRTRTASIVPGARVRVRLTIGKPYEALLVPETAILADQDKRYVLIADEKNVVRRRNVTLGSLTDDGMRAIQAGGQAAGR